MRIFLRSGGNPEAVEVSSTATIAELKAQVENVAFIPVGELNL